MPWHRIGTPAAELVNGMSNGGRCGSSASKRWVLFRTEPATSDSQHAERKALRAGEDRGPRDGGSRHVKVGWLLWMMVALAWGVGVETVDGQPARTSEQATFAAQVDVVEVTVSVTDRGGRSMRDLTEDDFEIYEDGQRQSLMAFRHIDVPREAFDVPVSYAPADVTSNGVPGRGGRVYLLLLDDLHTHPLRSAEVRGIAREFVERRMLVQDLMAVAMTSGLGPHQHFTNDRQRLLSAVEEFVGRYVYPGQGLRGWPDGPGRNGARRGVGGALGGFERMDRVRESKARNAREMLRSIERFAEWLGGVDARRKAMVLIGQGIDYGTRDLFGDREALALLNETAQAADAAARHNVTIYAIDPRGLPTATESGIRTRFLVDEASEATWRAKQSLRALAEETGGFAFINSNQFSEAFERIVEEQSTYYLLGYRAPRDVPDEARHQIRIRVKRPDVEVAARRSYMHTGADRGGGGLGVQMGRLFGSPLPQTGLPLQIASLAIGSDGNGAWPVILGVWLGPAAYGESAGPVDIVVGIVAANDDGVVLTRRTFEVSIPAEMRGAFGERGLRILSRVDLPSAAPAHVRVVVVDRLTRAAGSVHHEVEAVDGRSAALSMSGVGMAAEAVVRVPTVVADPSVMTLVPFPIGVRRVFEVSDRLSVFAELYSSGLAPIRSELRLFCRIRDRAGEMVYETSERRFAGDGRVSYQVSVPLNGMEPGRYILEVGAATDRGGATVRRAVPFRIG